MSTLHHPHLFEPCICGHQSASHDKEGCLICAAHGQHCPSYWAQSDHDSAVQTGLVEILKRERALRSKEQNTR